MGTYGLGIRNPKGIQQINYAKEYNLYITNSFFKKAEGRRCTWCSTNGTVKNERDYIISNDKNIIKYSMVLNAINLGSDHRVVRAKVVTNRKKERMKKIDKKCANRFVSKKYWTHTNK